MRPLTSLFAALTFLAAATAPAQADDYRGTSFDEVWSQVLSDPYARLPHEQVTLSSFVGFLQDRLLESSRRTLSDRRDLLPRFRKLLHPNGTCLAGTWTITEATPYTGYFRKGRRALFVGRASAALTATQRGEYRAFGLAGKLFPTNDPDAVVPTANFFTIEDLGGTLRDHFLDALNTNDIIRISITSEGFWNTAVGIAVARAFSLADGALDLTQTLVRQLYPIAELGEPASARTVAPRWMMIVGSAGVPRFLADDFREELSLEHYPGGLRFDILVADVGTRLGTKSWRKIGVIDIDDQVSSDSCDHRLHFSHPRFRR